MNRQIRKAKKIKVGDSLPGLDNGYVIDVEQGSIYASFDERYGTNQGGPDSVLITFHDAQGDEAYLLCKKSMPITVDRP